MEPDVPVTIADLLQAAAIPYQGGPYSVAARDLQKHDPAKRAGSPYPKPVGNPDRVSDTARRIVGDILGNPGTRIYVYKGIFIHARPPDPDRRMIRWRITGEFVGFLEKP